MKRTEGKKIVMAGAGSGGSQVLDFVARETDVQEVSVFDPDIVEEANLQRHLAGRPAIGQAKVDFMRDFLATIRPDLRVNAYPGDITADEWFPIFREEVASADVAVCNVDVEAVKFTFNKVCLDCHVPWTMGEVLSGGIGGLVHLLRPGRSACYACTFRYLERPQIEKPKPRDYSAGAEAEPVLRIPASKASIGVIAALHALETLKLARDAEYAAHGQTLLIGLGKKPGIFDLEYAISQFVVPRATDCLVCGGDSPADLQAAIHEAYAAIPEEQP
jgi:molybdopterin/thiamine biosynthesis adenylyltransferase